MPVSEILSLLQVFFIGNGVIWILLTHVRFKCPIKSVMQSAVLVN